MKTKTTLVGLVLLTSLSAFAGDKGGNGGDTLKCMVNGVQRYLVLDSVMVRNSTPYTIRTEKSYSKQLKHIIKKLMETIPLRGEELSRFVDSFEKKGRINGDGIIFWIAGKPRQVKDENLHIDIPSYCDGRPLQTVVYVPKPARFYYDRELINKLKNEKDELSWLLVHEWLRTYIDDADNIRILNGFLHSEEFLEYGEDDLRSMLYQFNVPRHWTRSELEGWYSKNHTLLSQVNMKAEEVKQLVMTDLGGLSRPEIEALMHKRSTLSHYFHQVLTVLAHMPPFERIEQYRRQAESAQKALRKFGQ